MQPLAFIPSPSQGVWHLGPFPLRAYALMIIIGIVVAVWLGERRWTARGGTPGVVIDCAVWAVPFGLAGGRLYHVITDYQRYFGEGRDPVDALKVWEGGLGIWGAVILGGVGAWIACRRRGVSVLALGDAVAPGIALAQAIGRWGNWWNQELYGRPLSSWWAVQIDPMHRPQLDDGTLDPKYADIATYHPTFLYESLWCVGVAVLVIWAGRKYSLTHGRTFALYVAAYTLGRAWIEFLRIDDAHHILGLRLNDWTALLVFTGAVTFIRLTRGRTGPEAVTVTGKYAERLGEPQPAEAAGVTATTGEGAATEAGAASEDSATAAEDTEPAGDGATPDGTATSEDTATADGTESAEDVATAEDTEPAEDTEGGEDTASAEGAEPAEDAEDAAEGGIADESDPQEPASATAGDEGAGHGVNEPGETGDDTADQGSDQGDSVEEGQTPHATVNDKVTTGGAGKADD